MDLTFCLEHSVRGFFFPLFKKNSMQQNQYFIADFLGFSVWCVLRSCEGYIAFLQLKLEADVYWGFDLCDNSLKQV